MTAVKMYHVSEVDKQITSFPTRFAINRSSFSSNLLTKATKNRANASQILHFVFSVPCGSAQIPPADCEHVDAVHAMLHLANGQALLNITHPLSQEHGATTERIRFFFAAGKEAEQLFRCPGKQTVAGQFLQALGATNTLCSANSLAYSRQSVIDRQLVVLEALRRRCRQAACCAVLQRGER